MLSKWEMASFTVKEKNKGVRVGFFGRLRQHIRAERTPTEDKHIHKPHTCLAHCIVGTGPVIRIL